MENVIVFAIKRDPLLLINIPDSLKSFSVCLAAVNLNPTMIQYCHQHDDDDDTLALAAVDQNGLCLQYIPHPSPQVILAAVNQNGTSIRHGSKQLLTSNVVCHAIRQTTETLKYLDNQTEEYCQIALCQNLDAIFYIRCITPGIRNFVSKSSLGREYLNIVDQSRKITLL
jgi:hypothetical protein